MKLKIITFCLLFAVIFFSCKKVDLSDGLNSPGSANSYVALLSKVQVDNQSINEYLYSDSNLITEEKTKFDFTQHHYNSKGQLATSEFYTNDNFLSSDAQVFQTAMNSTAWVTPSNGLNGGMTTYEYNDNAQLIKATYSRPSSTVSEYSEFSYTNNRISRQTMYWENSATGYIDYSYDAKGNLTKEMLYNLPLTGAAELITTTQYAYDNQQNPYKATSRLLTPGVNTNLNNIVKETYTIHLAAGQGADNVQVTETAYEYNGMGYPVSKNGNVTFIYQ